MKERGPDLLKRLRANVVTLRAHLGAAARPHLNQVELGVAVLQRRYAELREFLKEDIFELILLSIPITFSIFFPTYHCIKSIMCIPPPCVTE